MAKYKVEFRGFVYVEADNAEEAEEKFDDEDYVFAEYGITSVEEIDEFKVRV